MSCVIIRNMQGSVLYRSKRAKKLCTALEEAVRNRVSLRFADLGGRDLREIDLNGADLSHAFLQGTNLSSADLCHTNLSYAYLSNVNMSSASLYGCSMYMADLHGANLVDAEYSISQVMLAMWRYVSPGLCRDLMRLDASAHPNPEMFNAWAEGGDCPYSANENCGLARVCLFGESRAYWKSGRPPSLWNLWCRLANEHEVKIGYDKKGKPVKE